MDLYRELMSKAFDLVPRKVPKVKTKYRRIVTEIPSTESIPLLKKLYQLEPFSMQGQPPIIWDRAEGINVYDPYGNKFLDFSSGVLVANAGHGRHEIRKAIEKVLHKPLLHNYCFPSLERLRFAEKILSLLPKIANPNEYKVFLTTTGSEAIEVAIKLSRAYGQKISKEKGKKVGLVSFEGSFHGRTLGAQMIGGMPKLKEWIPYLDPEIWQVPFPDGYRCEDVSFNLFLRTLEEKKVSPDRIVAVISETYQGGSAAFTPIEYMKNLRKWTEEHDILLVLDEIQAGFGRTGKMFGFEHYEIMPDIFVCGKGITSSLPLSCVIGKKEIMDLFPSGTMSSTHLGNPICISAALASIELIEKENLVENAYKMGKILHEELNKIKKVFSDVIGCIQGRGLVAGVHFATKDKEPLGDLAALVVRKCVEKGLLLFAPVGFGGATIKINPPLIINEEPLLEGIEVFSEAIRESIEETKL
jgi:4-aminobutyrate aminotransferase-like enzyme